MISFDIDLGDLESSAKVDGQGQAKILSHRNWRDCLKMDLGVGAIGRYLGFACLRDAGLARRFGLKQRLIPRHPIPDCAAS